MLVMVMLSGSNYVCDTYYVLHTLAITTAYVSDTGNYFSLLTLVFRMLPATISSYSYDHTVDAGTRRVLILMWQLALWLIQSQDVTQLFPVSAATHNGRYRY